MSSSTKLCVEDYLTTWGNAHEKKGTKLEGKTERSVTSLMALLPLLPRAQVTEVRDLHPLPLCLMSIKGHECGSGHSVGGGQFPGLTANEPEPWATLIRCSLKLSHRGTW